MAVSSDRVFVCVELNSLHNRNLSPELKKPILMLSGPEKVQARRVKLTGNVEIKFDPDHPLPNGAVVWVECDDAEILE